MTEVLAKQHGLESYLRSSDTGSSVNAGVKVSILSDFAHINLRGDASDDEFLASAEKVLQQPLPLATNSSRLRGEQRIFWLGPNEWLIIAPGKDRLDTRALKFANDISGGQVVLRLSGAAVEQLLAKGCTLDLAADKFAVGSCAQAGLAKAAVLIARIDDAGSFDIVVRRSFAEYLVKWLHSAGREFGIDFSAR